MLDTLRKDKHWVEYPFGSLFYGYIFRQLKDIKIHPNWYTLGFIAFGMFSGVLFSMNYFLISYLFWRFSVVLDLVDGPIARYKNKTSLLGEYLDNIGHVLCGLFLVLGSVYGSSTENRILLAMTAGFMFLLVYTLKYVNYTVIGNRQKIRLSKNKHLLFLEKRFSDFFDIEILFLLPLIPREGFVLFIGVKIVRAVLIIYKSVDTAKKSYH